MTERVFKDMHFKMSSYFNTFLFLQVIQLPARFHGDGILQVSGNSSAIFGITAHEGMIYVKNENKLHKAGGERLLVEVVRTNTSEDSDSNTPVVNVIISINHNASEFKHFDHCGECPTANLLCRREGICFCNKQLIIT